MGTRAALLYSEQYRPQVGRLLLIAAFANRIENAFRRGGDAYPDFFDHKVNLEIIKKYTKKRLVLHSQDDSSIMYEQATEIARGLDAELLTSLNRNHFCSTENAQYIFEVLKNNLTI